MSKQFQKFCERAGSKHTPTSAYHPEGDGNIEIKNKALKKIQVIFNEEGANWILKVAETQMQLNNRYNTSRKVTLFFVLYGFPPRMGPSLLPEPVNPYSSPAKRYQEIAEALTEAKIT